MKVTRTSILTGVTRTLDFNISEAQWNKYLDGKLIQNVLPHLSINDREFIINGTTTEEWDKYLPEPEEPED